MELKILEEKANPLLERKDVKASLSYDSITPSRKDLAKAVADKVKAKPELVIIPQIKNVYGERKAWFEAHVYDNAEVIPLIENRNTIFRHQEKDKVKEAKEKLKAAKKERKAKRKKKHG